MFLLFKYILAMALAIAALAIAFSTMSNGSEWLNAVAWLERVENDEGVLACG